MSELYLYFKQKDGTRILIEDGNYYVVKFERVKPVKMPWEKGEKNDWE